MKKIMRSKNPIVRNVVVILGIIVLLVVLGLVANFGKFLIDWFLTLGAGTLITIALTSLVCGVIFGYAEMRNTSSNKVVSKKTVYEDEYED